MVTLPVAATNSICAGEFGGYETTGAVCAWIKRGTKIRRRVVAFRIFRRISEEQMIKAQRLPISAEDRPELQAIYVWTQGFTWDRSPVRKGAVTRIVVPSPAAD